MDWAHNLLKVWKWLASKCVTEVNVNVAQGPYIHWSTVKHSAEMLQAASKKLVEGSRCSTQLPTRTYQTCKLPLHLLESSR